MPQLDAPGLKLIVWNGISISPVHPISLRSTRAFQMPSQDRFGRGVAGVRILLPESGRGLGAAPCVLGEPPVKRDAIGGLQSQRSQGGRLQALRRRYVRKDANDYRNEDASKIQGRV